MHTESPRLQLIQEYESAPENALFKQQTVAAILNCSLATLERDRWAGRGIHFLKIGRMVRYRKTDIQRWLAGQRAVQSTTEAQQGLGSSFLSEGL